MGTAGDVEQNRKRRSKLYKKHHGAPEHVFPATADAPQIEAFGFDFSSDEDDEDIGYVLITNGMSDRPMQLDAAAKKAFAEGEVKQRAELIWYVRDLDDDIILNMQWLAQFPFIDKTWLGFGHSIPMPKPIFEGSTLQAFFFLTPIVRRHQEIAEALDVDGDPVELLTVNLLTPEELALKKKGGVDAILELFDENDHPLVFDPERESYV